MHENTGNAQVVWKDDSSYMKTSTETDTQLEDPMSLILQSDLPVHIADESFVPFKSRFPSFMEKAMLKNTLQGHEVFANAMKW